MTSIAMHHQSRNLFAEADSAYTIEEEQRRKAEQIAIEEAASGKKKYSCYISLVHVVDTKDPGQGKVSVPIANIIKRIDWEYTMPQGETRRIETMHPELLRFYARDVEDLREHFKQRFGTQNFSIDPYIVDMIPYWQMDAYMHRIQQYSLGKMRMHGHGQDVDEKQWFVKASVARPAPEPTAEEVRVLKREAGMRQQAMKQEAAARAQMEAAVKVLTDTDDADDE